MKVRTLQTEVFLPRPRDEVFAFFADAHNLDHITPPWLHFRILTPKPISMKKGALIKYRLRLRGLPIRWRTEITAWEPPAYFEDRQMHGPYKSWLHKHKFEESNGGTSMADDVEYSVPGFWLEPLLNGWLVEPDLHCIFAYRKARMLEIFVSSD